MQTLVSDLISYSRAVNEETSQPAPVADAETALTDALDVLRLHISDTGALISSDSLPMVYADAPALSEIFQQLLGNALKFRRKDEPPRVHVSALRRGTDCVFTIRDHGIGFAPEYAEYIFGIFKRLHGQEYNGSGIGLGICRRMIEKYGGRIWSESAGPGQGSAFHFTLSAAREILPTVLIQLKSRNPKGEGAAAMGSVDAHASVSGVCLREMALRGRRRDVPVHGQSSHPRQTVLHDQQ